MLRKNSSQSFNCNQTIVRQQKKLNQKNFHIILRYKKTKQIIIKKIFFNL